MRSFICLVVIIASIVTVDTSPAQDKPDDSLAQLKFLAGVWKGEMNGDLVEEHWSEPAGESLVGMFRWVGKDSKVRLYELLTIKSEADGPTLRLRHFDGAFTPWASERDGVPSLRMSECAGTRVVFTNVANAGLKSCEYEVKGDLLSIVVSFHDPNRQPLKFAMKRVR